MSEIESHSNIAKEYATYVALNSPPEKIADKILHHFKKHKDLNFIIQEKNYKNIKEKYDTNIYMNKLKNIFN